MGIFISNLVNVVTELGLGLLLLTVIVICTEGFLYTLLGPGWGSVQTLTAATEPSASVIDACMRSIDVPHVLAIHLVFARMIASRSHSC